MMTLKMLLVRVDLAGSGFGLGGTEETVLGWLRRAVHHAEESNRHLLRALPVTQVQRDEMWNFSARTHMGETDATGASGPESAEGRQGGWISCAPECRLMIAAIVGPRTLDTAQEIVAATKARGAGIPAFFRDGFPCYRPALIAACHGVTTFARTGTRGRPRKSRWEPHPDLVYGHLVKQKRLLLDSRVVHSPMASTPSFVLLSSLTALFFKSLKNELRFSDNRGA